MSILTFLTLTTLCIAIVSGLSSTGSSYEARLRSKVASSIAKGERRALERRTPTRDLCSRCRRPPVQCVCSTLPKQKIQTATQILILQHPAEFRRRTFSTVPLVSLVLQNATVRVGHTFEPDQVDAIRQAIENNQQLFLLFPGPDALSLDDGPVESNDDEEIGTVGRLSLLTKESDKPNMLILFDGTWTQARAMVRNSPALLDCCQQVQFSCDSKSIYDAIRREPQGHCLSTLEACARALQLLEPNKATAQEASRHLHEALQTLVEKHLWFSSSSHADPRFLNRGENARKKRQRRLEIEKEIFGTTSEPYDAQECIVLNDGAILRPLTVSDAEYVDSRWPHRSKKSLKMIEKQIEAGVGCFGIQVNNKLCASIMRYHNGSIGMLHVDEAYRRRGYATALLTEAAASVGRQEECFAFIRDGNEASQQLFANLGWVRADPTEKPGTGRRRAKRKWIKHL